MSQEAKEAPKQQLDEQKAQQFANKMTEIANAGAFNIMLSIGHRTGLFDKLAELNKPLTSVEIAQATNMNERYIREWLHAMTTGRVVEYDPAKQTFFFPPEHAACLTRAASPNNIAVQTQFVSVLGNVEDQIITCFKQGGGVKYEEFEGFHRVMAEESAQTVLPVFIPKVLPAINGLTEQLQSEQGLRVLDIGCGSGLAMIRMAKQFPNSQFFGYDLSPEAVERAQTVATKEGLKNMHFVVKDLTDWKDEKQVFDVITAFDAIHDQAQPMIVLKNINHALKDDGVFIMQDICAHSQVEKNMDNPFASFLYTISTLHCMTVSLAYGGEGLGTAWGVEKALEYLDKAGFPGVNVLNMPTEPLNSWYICRKHAPAKQ